MITPFIDTAEANNGWHSAFAFQVVHRSPEEWQKMRWGFNAAALLEEALDRTKLFIETHSVNDFSYFDKGQPVCTIALRGQNIPSTGTIMVLLGKVIAQDKQMGLDYARQIFSIFPHDFILLPAKTRDEYYKLAGIEFFSKKPNVVAIQRGQIFFPPMRLQHEIRGFWQASPRSNEQIWRALSNMTQGVILNILLQPTLLFDNEKERLIQIQKSVSDLDHKSEVLLPYQSWLEEYIKRRLAPWKKFFLVQVHVMFEGNVENHFLHSVGSAITRDSDELPLPGYEFLQPVSEAEKSEWITNIQSLTVSNLREINDIADLDEAFAVFRFPFQPETGLPGTNFAEPLIK